MLRHACIVMWVIALIATAASAQTKRSGSGPYPVIIEGDPGVSGHTIYRPEDLGSFDQKNPLPIFAWGNGACMNSNTMYASFLAEIASHGFLVVAIGPYSAEAFSARGGPGGGLISDDDWTWHSGAVRTSGGVAPDIIHIGDRYYVTYARGADWQVDTPAMFTSCGPRRSIPNLPNSDLKMRPSSPRLTASRIAMPWIPRSCSIQPMARIASCPRRYPIPGNRWR
jgi:hypothetical protein